MRTRTKYAIIFGIIGFFISLVVFFISGFMAWAMFIGDAPGAGSDSPIAGLMIYFMFFGIPIISWFLIVFLGYKLGKAKEKSS